MTKFLVEWITLKAEQARDKKLSWLETQLQSCVGCYAGGSSCADDDQKGEQELEVSIDVHGKLIHKQVVDEEGEKDKD